MTLRKKISYITILVFTYSCGQNAPVKTYANKIKPETVDSVWIYKTIKPEYVPAYHVVKLYKDDADKIVKDINNATDRGLCKFMPSFNIVVYIHNDSIRRFRACSGTFKDMSGDEGYDFGADDYLDKYFVQTNP